MAVAAGQRVYELPIQGRPITNDAAIASGMAYLVGELEKRDPRLLEPLQSVTWQRDIVPRTGGGFVDYTSNLFVGYATTGGNENGIIGGETNDIPLIQADTNKEIYKVWNFSNILKVPFIDQQKLQQAGRSLNDILDNGIRLNWNKSLDNVMYTGVPSENVPGIVNNPNVTASTAATGASGSTNWSKKTPDEILADINGVINSTWAESQYDLTGMANHILVPPAQYGLLATTIVSSAGNRSILDYLLENNLGRNQGVDVMIFPSRWCIGAGTGDTDRMVAYVNADNRLNFDLTVPLSRVMTEQSVQQLAYLTAYVGQFSQPKFLYEQCVAYVDGI